MENRSGRELVMVAHSIESTQSVPQTLPTRDVLVDALRGLAITCMLVAHATPLLGSLPVLPAAALDVLNDVASPLFALVMGMAGAIVLRRKNSTAVGFLASRVVQGLMLILVGVVLASPPTWVGVVLPQLGVLVVVGAPLLLLPERWYKVAAVIALVLGPIVAQLTGLVVPQQWIINPGEGPALLQWLVTGLQYRVSSLLPFFLFGAFLWSSDALRRWAPCKLMALFGTTLTLFSYAAALYAGQAGAAYLVSSGGYIDLIRDGGLVSLMVGVAGMVAMKHVSTSGKVGGILLSALAGPGKLALSLYAAHILLLVAVVAGVGSQSPAVRAAVFAAFILGIPVLGWLWSRYLGKGPLERVMSWLGETARKLVNRTTSGRAG